jgi:putative transposase
MLMVPPKISIFEYMGIVKGRTTIRVFNKFRHLKKTLYWDNHFGARGYCVDTVGRDADKIRRYVKYQEAKDRQSEKRQQRLF